MKNFNTNNYKDSDNMDNMSLKGQEMSEMKNTFEGVHGKVTTDAQKKVEYMKKLEAEQELPPVTGEEKKIALLKCEKNGNEYILYAIMIVDRNTKIVDSIDTFLYDCTKKEALIGDESVSFKRENLLKENASYKDLNSLKKYNVDINVDQLSLAFERLLAYIEKGKSISYENKLTVLNVYKRIMAEKEDIVSNYENCEMTVYHGKKVLKIAPKEFTKILDNYDYTATGFMKILAKYQAVDDKEYYFATKGKGFQLNEKNNMRRYCLVIPEENTTTLDNDCAA